MDEKGSVLSQWRPCDCNESSGVGPFNLALNANVGIRMMVCLSSTASISLVHFLSAVSWGLGTRVFRVRRRAAHVYPGACSWRLMMRLLLRRHIGVQGRNLQEAAWDRHAPMQPSKVSKPKQPPPPLPLDQALAEIRSSTASIIDFEVPVLSRDAHDTAVVLVVAITGSCGRLMPPSAPRQAAQAGPCR